MNNSKERKLYGSKDYETLSGYLERACNVICERCMNRQEAEVDEIRCGCPHCAVTTWMAYIGKGKSHGRKKGI